MSTTTFVPGNRRALYIGLQTAKGTVQATPTLKLRVQDFSPNEVRQKIELEETDGADRILLVGVPEEAS